MMSNQKENNPKKSTHSVYFIKRKGLNAKPEWKLIGHAWEHADGEGLNLVFFDDVGKRIALTVRKNQTS